MARLTLALLTALLIPALTWPLAYGQPWTTVVLVYATGLAAELAWTLAPHLGPTGQRVTLAGFALGVGVGFLVGWQVTRHGF